MTHAAKRATRASRGKYVIAIIAVAVWAALRLLPGDITPEAPATYLRSAPPTPPPPRRLWQPPRPFPSYDPSVAYSLLDHVNEASVSYRQPGADAEGLRDRVKALQRDLTSRWRPLGGRWRVFGDGVLTCLQLPEDPGTVAAAVRRRPAESVTDVRVQVRFLTPPVPGERVGLSAGLSRKGSGVALMVRVSESGGLVLEVIRVAAWRTTEVLAWKELPVAEAAGGGPTAWVALALHRSDAGWQARFNDVTELGVSFGEAPGESPGVLLAGKGTRVGFFGFSVNGRVLDDELQGKLGRLAEELRLANLLTSPGDINLQFQEGGSSLVHRVSLDGVTRPALLAPAPSQVSFVLPRGSGDGRFEGWVGIHPSAWAASDTFGAPVPTAEPVRVEVVLATNEETRVIESAVLDPGVGADRAWRPVSVPVPEGAKLLLRARGVTEPDTETAVPGAYVVWGNPVVRWSGALAYRPSVVVIDCDSLRADALAALATEGVRTPAIDRLVAEGVLFERAFSQAPWSTPSLATLLSSLWPEVHGANPKDPRTPGYLAPAAVTLAEVFRRAGYRTAWVGDAPPPERVGLEQGFEEVVTVTGDPATGSFPLFERAFDYAKNAERSFVFVHSHKLARVVSEVLGEPPRDLEELHRELRRRYLEELVVFDRELASFIASMEDYKVLENSFVVLVGDHGTDLCERYPTIVEGGPGLTLREEQLHVPLIIRAPKHLQWRGRVAGQVRLIDVAPTVSELVGLPTPGEWMGHSLASTAQGRAPTEELPVFASACTIKPDRAAVRARGYSYIRILRPKEPRGRLFLEPLADEQLYNLRRDPGETRNIAGGNPEVLQAMRDLLLEHLGQCEEDRRRLFPELAPQRNVQRESGARP